MSIQELEVEVARLQEALSDAIDRLDAMRVNAAEFKVGDVVLVQRRGQGAGEEAIVREVKPMSWGPWYVVSFKKKDGSWSKSIYRAFGDVRSITSDVSS